METYTLKQIDGITKDMTEVRIKESYQKVCEFIGDKYSPNDEIGRAMKAGAEMLMSEVFGAMN